MATIVNGTANTSNMEERENEANFFAISLYNGILFGFGIFKYPEQHITELAIHIPFVKFSWVKQMMNDEEAENFLNQNQN